MSQETLYWIVAAGVGVAALSMAVQAVAWFGVARALKGLREDVNRVVPRAESVIESAEKSLDQSRRQFNEVAAKANAVLDTTKAQLERVDGVLAEAADRARVQMQRVEMVLDDTLGQIHRTVTVLNNGILKPLREVNAISAGVRAAVTHFLTGRRPNVAQATSDEEMFI
jgi:ABC-type transporter Mla subunit MlaD